MMPDTLFRQMLTDIRQEKGLLQSEVAEKLGKNQSFVSKYERGERRLDLPDFLDVAELLEVNPLDCIEKYRTELARQKALQRTHVPVAK